MELRVVDQATTKAAAKARPSGAPALQPADKHKRNPGYPLDLDWVGRIRMNRSALERRAATPVPLYQVVPAHRHGAALAAVHAALHRQVPDVNVWMVNVARGTYQLERVRFDALNPTFLVGATKPL